MLSTLKLAFLCILTGGAFYLFASVFGLSTIQYQHIVLPSLSEREHPMKTTLKINETYTILHAFHNIYYDPYDLYI